MKSFVRSFFVALPMLFAPMLPAVAQDASAIVTFSSATAGQPHPRGWEVMRINPTKKLTEYGLVDDGGTVVLHAVSAQSASALGQYIAVDLEKTPVVEWRWKISHLIKTADMEAAATEDSPVRLVFAFDGDPKKLPIADRASGAVAKSLSGRALPFATLMYVWANVAPVDKIIRNPHTGTSQDDRRLQRRRRCRQMAVAVTQPARGLQTRFRRIPRQDVELRRVRPTPTTPGESVEAWYGDIVFKPAR
jgi:hypothetical protein